MKAIVCLGSYAKSPYYFEKLGIHVFCMEELCWCLKENAFLVGPEIMNDRLVRFIEEDCDVPELAGELYPLVHQKGSLSRFVSLILEYVGLYDAGSVRRVEETLKRGAGLTDYEKQKLQIDCLVQKRKHSAAVARYRELAEHLAGTGEDVPGKQKLISELYHNQGVALANLMLYEDAARSFLKAEEAFPHAGEYLYYLAAKRQQLSESEYIAFVADKTDRYSETLELEHQMEGMEQSWHMTPEYNRITSMKFWRDNGENQKYDEENENIIQALKEEYRDSVETI